MDFEKEYKSLVGRITKAHLYAQTDSTRAVLEDIYPSLAESEDERILNGLIAAIKDQISCGGEFYFGIPLKDILAYLEKQKEQNLIMAKSPQLKEQKPAEWSEEDIDASVKSYSDSLPMCGEFQSYRDALVHAYRQGIVNALKDLRPSWKPSEEQEEPEYYQHPV